MQYEGHLRAREVIARTVRDQTGEELGRALDDDMKPEDLLDDRSRELARRPGEALQRGNVAEREVVLRARTSGEVSPAATDEVLCDIESQATRIAG